MIDKFYAGKRIAITGHTGFKGAWLSLWLRELGAEVHGLSLEPPTRPCLHEITAGHAVAVDRRGDIRDLGVLREFLATSRPDLVFHLAAQPLVRRSYREPMETLTVNAIGTANLLEAVRSCSLPAPVILVTTDKCYENRGWEFGYRENDSLGGADVYSASKAACELIAAAWRRSFFGEGSGLGPVATVRAGNVIGGGDYAEDRILPDLVRAQIEGRVLEIRNPSANRPWQHVLDCLGGYLVLGAALGRPGNRHLADSFNFGPGPSGNRSVGDLVALLDRFWPVRWTTPVQPSGPHEASRLNLTIDKASEVLGWRPVWTLEEAVRATADWYRARHSETGRDMLSLSRAQIAEFMSTARTRWSFPLL